MKKEGYKIPIFGLIKSNEALLFIILLIVEVMIIWVWVDLQDLDPSITIGVIVIFPTLLVSNIIFSGISFFLKLTLTKSFLILAVIMPFISSAIFLNGIKKDVELNNDLWSFFLNDTTYEISLSKNHNLYGISHSPYPGFSIGVDFGNWEAKNDTIYLYSDSMTMYINQEYLHNFRNERSPIELIKFY